MSDATTHLACPIFWPLRPRSTSPTTRPCACSTPWCAVGSRPGAPAARQPADGICYISARRDRIWAGWDLNIAFWVDGAMDPGWCRAPVGWSGSRPRACSSSGWAAPEVGRAAATSRTRSSASSTTPIPRRRRTSRWRGSPPDDPQLHPAEHLVELAILAGTQTFTGNKTFSGTLTASGYRDGFGARPPSVNGNDDGHHGIGTGPRPPASPRP